MMDCAQIEESLPWFLNGTLDADERRRVEFHLAGCERCGRALEETAFAGRAFGAHPPAEALVELAFGRPPTGVDPELLARHLELCGSCAEELEMARDCRRRESEGLDEADAGEGARVVPFRRPAPSRPAVSPAWRPAAVAATLAALLLGGGWMWSWQRTAHLETRVAELEAPRTGLWQGELFAQEATRRGAPGGAGEARNQLRVPASAEILVFALQPPAGVAEYAAYEIELVDEAGVTRWSGPARLQPEGDLLIRLWRHQLPGPRFTLLVHGVEGGEREPVASFPVEIEGGS